MERLWTKNFILLVLGQVCSLFGNTMLRLALSMYLLEKTGSAAVFAGFLSAAVLPTILLSPFGGVLADRGNKRLIMIFLDVLAGSVVLCCTLALTEQNAIPLIGALMIALSVLGAFETPTVQACIPMMLTGGNITKGNAVVNQAASLSALAAPALGGVLYAMLGLEPVMYASVVCFFLTALAECFIRLEELQKKGKEWLFFGMKNDIAVGMRFILQEERDVLCLLLLAAGSRFFVMGVTVVGLPFLVRTVLGLGAEYVGTAESVSAAAVILGSGTAGLLAEKWKIRRLAFVLAAMGASLFPAGMAFLLPVGTGMRYAAVAVSFFAMSLAVSIFSIFAVSLIQQRTPNALMGRVMAHTAAVTLCAQPLGQMAYGFLFDAFRNTVAVVLVPTGIFVCAVGLFSVGFFRGFEEKETKDMGTFGM